MSQENVFRDMPEHGTVVATISGVTLENIIRLSDEATAFRFAPQSEETRNEYRAFMKEYKDAWAAICLEFNFSNSWPVSYDELTGQVFINTK